MESNETGYEPRLGLRRVAPVKGGIDNTTLDIIAIHGLDTESPQTWTYKKNGSQAVNWLEDSDMLQAAVPNARIYTYNWNAKVFDDAPVQRLLGHADTLLGLVAGEQGSNSRPIIFVASCFGGLILAEAMNRAGQKDSPYQHILMNTAGMVFLATPFRGSDAAKPANWCVVVGGIMGKRTSEQLAEDLNKKDKELRKLTQLFAELIHHDTIKLPVHCFYETYKTKILRKWFPSKLVAILPPILSNRTELLLVTEDSACLDGVQRYPLNGDHSMMNKFDGPESANYQQVRNVIKEIAHNAFKTTEHQRSTQGRYIYQETLEDMRQDELHIRLQVDRIVSHLESQRRIEDIQAVVGNISGGLWKYARTRSEIPNADDHVRSPLVPTNSTFEVDIPNRIARLSYPTRSPVLRATDDSSELARDFDGLRCKCKIGRSLRIWNRGLLGFKVETQGTRRCPVHGQRSSTSYTIEAKLSPWINKTMELALLLNSGKGFAVCPSFKFRGIVKRSESAIFQLFDQFVDKCLITEFQKDYDSKVKEENYIYIIDLIKHTSVEAIWDEKGSTRAMPKLVRGIKEAIESGKASGDDSDENGNTLLTEISYVATLMQKHFRSVAPQMHNLLQLAQASKIDPMVAVSQATRKYTILHMTDKPVTAMSYLYSAAVHPAVHRESSYTNGYMSAFQALKSYEGAFESLVEYAPGSYRCRKLEILQADPELAEGLNYPNLHLAIIRRSLSALKSYFNRDWSELLDWRYLDPVELALGWTEGLQFLVDQGCHIGWAFETACEMHDVESASILLSSSSDIFSVQYSRRITSTTVNTFDLLELAMLSDDIFCLVAKELWQRRDELRRFSIAHSNFKQQLMDNFFGSLELDESTHDRLTEIPDLPDRLKCWDIGSPHCPKTLNHYIFNLKFHKILHDVGFVDMQALCRHGMTPLAEYCLIFERGYYPAKEWFDLAAWFARKGADPDFSHESQGKLRWPHLQFYVAWATDYTRDEDNEIYGIKKSTLTTDTCRCSCSSKGCIPPFLLWSCSLAERGMYHRHCELRIPFRERKLKYWMKLCGLKRRDQEKSYKELCRRELFDCLGMRHTCCCAALEVQTAQEEDKLLWEDASAKNELLWLVRVYAITRKLLPDATIAQFWELWWKVADDVLLPFLPEEACRGPWWMWYEDWFDCSEEDLKEIKEQVEKRRLDDWLALREEAGYEGWEDNQVFKFHFTRFWLLAKAHRQRLACWKRHRLMIKPRFILTKRGGMADVYMSC